MKQKLSRIRSPWRRLVLSLCMTSLVLINIFTSSRARIHWLGHYGRPRRRERALFLCLFLLSMLLLEAEQYLLWATAWGGALAIFINLHTIYRLIPLKRYHWLRSEHG
jgi:hypothetical protein